MTRQEKVRSFVAVALTVVGLLCYALSSNSNHLFQGWVWWKIFLYIVVSFIILLLVLFPDTLQRLRILRNKRFVKFLVSSSTTIFLFLSDRAAKGKPDAYNLVSCVAFAMMSHGCGFGELPPVFTGALTVQLMQIKLCFWYVGVVLSFIFIVPPSYLNTQQPDLVIPEMLEVVIHGVSTRSSVSSATAQNIQLASPHSSASSAQIHAIAKVDIDAATVKSNRHENPLFRHFGARCIPDSKSPPVLSMLNEITIRIGGLWIRINRAKLLEIVEEYQKSSFKKEQKLLDLDRSNESPGLMIDTLRLCNAPFEAIREILRPKKKWKTQKLE